MGLELVTGIWDFNTDWPLPTDKRRQGDDHLRNIKLGTKNTFPNILAPVTVSDTVLNDIPEDLSAILTEIINHLEPAGFIKAWHLAHGAVPTGWHICDGSTVVGYGVVPDMRDKFIIAAGSTYIADTTGGDDSVVTGDSGAHTPVVESHILTAGEIPAHDHKLYTWETGSSSDANNFGTVFSKGIAGNTTGTFAYRSANNDTIKLVENTGAAATGHTHPATAVPNHNHTVSVVPPYYATVFVVKTSSYTAP